MMAIVTGETEPTGETVMETGSDYGCAAACESNHCLTVKYAVVVVGRAAEIWSCSVTHVGDYFGRESDHRSE